LHYTRKISPLFELNLKSLQKNSISVQQIATMNPKAPVFRPSIFGPSVERKKITKTISKQAAALNLEDPTTFTRFMELPAELRLMIWRYALTFPQIHRVAPYDGNRGRFLLDSMVAIKYNPGLRSVCREAREEASKVQELYSTAELDEWRKRGGIPSIFVNPEIDTIFMGNMGCMFPNGGKPETYVGRIRRLAFIWGHWTSVSYFSFPVLAFLEAPGGKEKWCMGLWERGVEEILLVLDYYRKSFWEQEVIRFVEPIGEVYFKELGMVSPSKRKWIDGQLESSLNQYQEVVARHVKRLHSTNERGDCQGLYLRSCGNDM
jgi:hypothetical protein